MAPKAHPHTPQTNPLEARLLSFAKQHGIRGDLGQVLEEVLRRAATVRAKSRTPIFVDSARWGGMGPR